MDSTKEPELKPCPFCGAAGEYSNVQDWHGVGCQTRHCPGLRSALYHRSKDAAFAAWNRRESADLAVKWTGADSTSHEISLDYAAQIAKWMFDKYGDVPKVDAVLSGESAEGGEAASHYEQQQWRGKLFNLMQYWHSTRDGATSKAEAWNAIWSHVQNMGPGWRTREYLAASGEAKRGALPSQSALDSPSIAMPPGLTPGERRAFILGAAAGCEAGGMAEANLPELPESVAHVHSNGEVCMDRRVESGVWPVELVTLKQAHDYARAYAAALPVVSASQRTDEGESKDES